MVHITLTYQECDREVNNQNDNLGAVVSVEVDLSGNLDV